MGTAASGFGKAILALFAAIIIVTIVAASAFGLYAVSRPATTAVDYRTFKQSQQYNDGMANRLQDYETQYATGTEAQRGMIRSIVVHEYASYDDTKLNPELRDFLQEMRNNP